MGKQYTRMATILAAIVAAIAILLLVFDWNWFKGYVETKASEATGRKVLISNLDVDVLWPPQIHVAGIQVSNAAWSDTPQMIAVERAHLYIDALPLLTGDLVFPAIHLYHPRIVLERPQEGEPNWSVLTNTENGGAPPRIGRVDIEDGELTYRDIGESTEIITRVATTTESEGQQPHRRTLKTQGKGRLRNQPLQFDLTGGTLLSLPGESEPYPVQGTLIVGKTHIELNGTFQRPLQLQGPNLSLSVEGPNPRQLGDVFGIPTPSLPPYSVQGNVVRKKDTWVFNDFAGTIGDSDIHGNIEFDMGGERLLIRADLTSRRLDFDDLRPVVGTAPATGKGETASNKQQQRAEAQTQRKQVLPTAQLDLTPIRKVDATVHFQGKEVLAPNLPLDNVVAMIKLDNGQMSFIPLDHGVANGIVRSTIHIDARQDQVHTTLQSSIERVHLGKLLAQIEFAKESLGLIAGEIELSGTGSSIAAFLGSANGDMALIMTEGQLDTMLIELAGLDLSEALGALGAPDRNVPIRCAVADLKLTNGIMKVNSLVIDTEDTNLSGQGYINFAKERVDLILQPHPKDPSLLSANSPIHVRGPFTDISAAPDAAALGGRAAAALALSALATPLAGLIALIEPGQGEDAPCQQLMQEARQTMKDEQ